MTVTPSSIPSDLPSGKPLRKRKSDADKWTDSLHKLASCFGAIAPTQATTVVDQYSARLCTLLSELRARGFAAHRVCKRMNSALSNGNIGGYLNDASELAIVSHFLDLYPKDFRYQVPVEAGCQDSLKNFDFAFSVDGCTFNVEVKSFTPEPIDRQRRFVKSFLPSVLTHELINQGAEFEANCQPALIRLMTKASAQLPRSNHAHNVMMLCCNDPDEFADVLMCLIGPYGLCRPTDQNRSLPNLSNFPHIDTVVICHLGLQHLCVLDPRYQRMFFPNDSGDMDGGLAWKYSNSLPISVNLKLVPLARAQELALTRAFNLHDINFYPDLDRSCNNCQEVLFRVFNTLAPSLAAQRK